MFYKKKAILIAMCELSLMHYHSDDMFWHILEEMKNNNLNFQSVFEFEDYFYKKIYFLYQDYCNRIQETRECIDFMYPKSIDSFEETNKLLNSFFVTIQSTDNQQGLFYELKG